MTRAAVHVTMFTAVSHVAVCASAASPRFVLGYRSAAPSRPSVVVPNRFGTSLVKPRRRPVRYLPQNALPDACTAVACVEGFGEVGSYVVEHMQHMEHVSQQPQVIADISEGGLSSLILPLIAFAGGFGLYKTAVYWRVQFITAAMIGKHVPPGARRVLEYGIGQGKNLYYYPKTVGMLVGIDPDVKEDLLIQVSVASSIPFVAKQQSLEQNSGQGDASIDAVVTTGALGKSKYPEIIVTECARILKPGAPLVFVEDLGTLNEKSNVLDALTKSSAAGKFFEPASYDDLWATLPFSPTAIGVVVRKEEEGGPNTGSTSMGKQSKQSSGKKEKDDFEQFGKRGRRKK